jgi:hypothetical protein
MHARYITVDTPHGTAEATKSEHGDPWVITYPWGKDTFFGTGREVIAVVRQALAVNCRSVKPHP